MESSNERQQQFKNSKKSFFFGGKKKKRKPVCTCHLGYAEQNGTGSGVGGYQTTANHIYASPVKQANYPSYESSVVETTSQCFTRQQEKHYSSGYPPGAFGQPTYQPPLSPSPHHHSVAQMMECQVPQQLSAMSLQPAPYGMDGCANYLQLVDDKKYLYAVNGNSSGVYQTNSTYSPDLNLHRRLYGAGNGLEVPGRQRRWSDSGTRHSRTDQEAMQQECVYGPPPKGYSCGCGPCTQRALAQPPQIGGSQYPMPPGANYSPRPKPKVSFGPLMTYPNDNEQALRDAKAAKKSSSKLTTELLPLDTQFPLLMSDTAMLCTIQ